MGQFIDLTGQRFGRLVVINRAEDHFTKSGARITMWNCACDCGNKKTITANALRKGVTISCGCYAREINSIRTSERNRKMTTRNGLSKEKLFHVWNAIRHRCYFETDDFYQIYGGRGITMCDEWKENYSAFKEWALKSGWKDGLSIDRIDNNGPYSPENCRWATPKEQANNRRSNVIVSAFGKTKNLKAWSDETGIKYATLRARIVNRKWSAERALTEPVGGVVGS